MGLEVSVAVWYPTGHTTLVQRWINVSGVDSTSQQRRFSRVQIRLAKSN